MKRYELDPLKSLLKLYKTGQYNRIAGAIKRLPETKLLRTIPVEELEKIIGKKTSRFFILHSRENAECVPLDVHILRWLRIYGVNAPQNTPTTKIAYGYFEHQALRLFDLHFRGWATADVDLHVWQTMRGMEPETGNNMEIKTLKISDWIITTSVDEDDHLTMVVSNTDGTDIHDCFAEISMKIHSIQSG